MPAAPVILNNTPLVALYVLERLDILRDLFGEVMIPPAVHAEFMAIDRARRESALTNAAWIKVRSLAHPRRVLAFTGLDEGEAAVLGLAEELGGTVVIDERKARRYAKRLGLPLTGTIGLLLLAKERHLLTSVRTALDTLLAAGLHLNPDLITEALRLAGEA